MAADATIFMIMRCDNRPAALLSRIFGSAVMPCPSSCKTTANSHRLDGTGQTSASSAGSTHFPCADLVALWKSPTHKRNDYPQIPCRPDGVLQHPCTTWLLPDISAAGTLKNVMCHQGHLPKR